MSTLSSVSKSAGTADPDSFESELKRRQTEHALRSLCKKILKHHNKRTSVEISNHVNPQQSRNLCVSENLVHSRYSFQSSEERTNQHMPLRQPASHTVVSTIRLQAYQIRKETLMWHLPSRRGLSLSPKVIYEEFSFIPESKINITDLRHN